MYISDRDHAPIVVQPRSQALEVIVYGYSPPGHSLLPGMVVLAESEARAVGTGPWSISFHCIPHGEVSRSVDRKDLREQMSWGQTPAWHRRGRAETQTSKP